MRWTWEKFGCFRQRRHKILFSVRLRRILSRIWIILPYLVRKTAMKASIDRNFVKNNYRCHEIKGRVLEVFNSAVKIQVKQSKNMITHYKIMTQQRMDSLFQIIILQDSQIFMMIRSHSFILSLKWRQRCKRLKILTSKIIKYIQYNFYYSKCEIKNVWALRADC